MTTFTQCPGSNLDYVIDWSEWLSEGDIIASSEWSAGEGLEVGAMMHSDTQAITWLSGGVADTDYRVTNTITTAQGRVHCQQILVRIR